MELESVLAVLAGVTVLLIFGIVFLIGGLSRARPMGAEVGLPIALALLLLCVEHLTRLGWSYDLVARAPIRIYWPEAPITAFLGMIFLALIAAIGVCLVLMVALSRTIWVTRSSKRTLLVMLLACLPTLVLYAHQRGLQQDLHRRDEAIGYQRASQANIRRESACPADQSAEAAGCRRYVERFGHQSDANLANEGRNWGIAHHAESESACQSTAADFDPRPPFAEGCKAWVGELRRQRGERWAYEHNLESVDGCKSGAQSAEDPPTFLEGCAHAVHSSLSTQGENWARSQPIFDSANCQSRNDPDFIRGCENYVSHASPNSIMWDGINFARTRHLEHAAECYTSVPNAPAQFSKACEEEVRGPRREQGKRLVYTKAIVNEADCGTVAPEPHTPAQEIEADIIQGCRDEVISQRVVAGRFWANQNLIFAPADCRSDLPGVKHNPQFVEGCEDFIQHRHNGQEGYNYASKRYFARVEQCHGAVRNAPPQFVSGCELFVQQREQANRSR